MKENIKTNNKFKISIIVLLLILTSLYNVSCNKIIKINNDNNLTFTHYSTNGVVEDFDMDILFEESNSTFTAYQVAYLSCTCRDSLVSFKSVCYVEILNTKDSGDEAAIRYMTFGENKGLFGDTNPNYNKPNHTEEYFDKNLVKPLIGVTKKEIDEFTGYGYLHETLDVDAMAGATVTATNLQSMLKSLFSYHKNKYYNGK